MMHKGRRLTARVRPTRARTRIQTKTKGAPFLVIMIATLALALSACAGTPAKTAQSGADSLANSAQSNNQPKAQGDNRNGNQSNTQVNAQQLKAGNSLIIQTADIGSEAQFFGVKVDGTYMEVLAFKASDGSIRTALNTCAVCYDSGYGYYEQEGDVLVCQNCGNRFPADKVEVERGGCNPVPVFEDEKTVTTQSISIPYETFASYTTYFKSWKR